MKLGRKFKVRVRFFNKNHEFIDGETIEMFRNSAITDPELIYQDFTEKLDLYPARYGLDINKYKWFTIETISNTNGFVWPVV